MIDAPVKEGFQISQGWGKNPDFYARWGLDGHNGEDIACPVGTEVYAPIDGKVKIKSDPNGYGDFIYLEGSSFDENNKRRRITLAHLSSFKVKNGAFVNAGDVVALSGNTGASTGPHLHFDMVKIDREGRVQNKDNGMLGRLNIFQKKWINVREASKY